MRLVRDWLTRERLSLLGLGVLLPAYCFIGCGNSAVSRRVADERALEVWRRHEAVVELAINGRQNEDAFVNACLFFEQVTGISIHVNIFTFGFIPEAEAANDLKLIRAWYRENHERLYWDEVTGSVKVRPDRNSFTKGRQEAMVRAESQEAVLGLGIQVNRALPRAFYGNQGAS